MELNYDGKYTVGASHPGIPFILIGKTNKYSWGMTSALTDSSDLFREKLNE